MPAKRDWDEVDDPDVLRDEIFRLQGELEKAKKRAKVAETSAGSSGATSGRAAAPAVTEALIEKTKAALIKQIKAQVSPATTLLQGKRRNNYYILLPVFCLIKNI